MHIQNVIELKYNYASQNTNVLQCNFKTVYKEISYKHSLNKHACDEIIFLLKP